MCTIETLPWRASRSRNPIQESDLGIQSRNPIQESNPGSRSRNPIQESNPRLQPVPLRLYHDDDDDVTTCRFLS